MLVLQRKENEAILLPGGIRIVVNDIRGKRVSIAFEAPPEVYICREELADELDDAQRDKLGLPKKATL